MTSIFGSSRKRTKQPEEIKILAWEDDPLSTNKPVERPKPDLASLPLKITINEIPPLPEKYKVGTPEFRYWTAAEALHRGLKFWCNFLPNGKTWQSCPTLQVWLDNDTPYFNAYYDRCKYCPPCELNHCRLEDEPCDINHFGLSFFHDMIHGTTIYSGESPDIVCHELGHAVLDALQPELWCANLVEVAAFHESFADISAILSALQLPSLRQSVLKETGGRLYQSSRLTRLGEQLSWAIRQLFPDAVEQDCLRNAVNSFFYQDPETLPPISPIYSLSTEEHSFSRVFTGAFFEALAGMFEIHLSLSKQSAEEVLREVSNDMGQLLVDAVLAEKSSIYYFSQIAGDMIKADANRFDKKYLEALKPAFAKRGILSYQSIKEITNTASDMISNPPKRRTTRRPRSMVEVKEPRIASSSLDPIILPGTRYGLGNKNLFVNVPRKINSPGATPEAIPPGSFSLPSQEKEATAREAAARTFADGLFIRGKVDLGFPTPNISHFGRKTHKLIEEPEGFVLVRILFE